MLEGLWVSDIGHEIGSEYLDAIGYVSDFSECLSLIVGVDEEAKMQRWNVVGEGIADHEQRVLCWSQFPWQAAR